MKPYSNRSAIFFLSVILGTSPLFPEVIHMRDGQVIEGSITGQTRTTVRVATESATLELKKTEIKRIVFTPYISPEEKARKEREKKEAEEKAKQEARDREEEAARQKEKEKSERQQKQTEARQQSVREEQQKKEAAARQIEREQQRKITETRISQKVDRERSRHDRLMQERIRLQYTEGLLAYSGGQKIHTEMMEKDPYRFYVKTDYGLFDLFPSDFSTMVIETDTKSKTIQSNQILAVKTADPRQGVIYLKGGTILNGKVEGMVGTSVIISSEKGRVVLPASDVLFPALPPNQNLRPGIHVSVGQKGDFYFNDNQVISGTLILLSKYRMAVQTEYGLLDLDPAELVSAVPEEKTK